jgi:hypothetical protein
LLELFVLDFRAAEIGGGFAGPLLLTERGRALDPGALLALGAGGPLTFLLHGFNLGRSAGRASLLEFGRLLRAAHPDLAGRLVAVLWPGDDLLSPLTYSLEERDADETARRLAALCTRTLRLREPPSFVAHSLGCRVALETMARLHAAGRPLAHAVLMAGAVDADCLARADRYRASVAAARRVAVLHSGADLVLRLAFPLGDAVASLLFGGYTRSALGLTGPQPGARKRETIPAPSVSALSLTRFGVGHLDYLGNPEAARYAGDVLAAVPAPEYR